MGDFDRRLSFMTRGEQQFSTSIFHEQIAVATPEHHHNDRKSDVKSTSLGQSMIGFGAFLKTEEARLHQLFDEWNTVQTKIIALAIRVVGRDAVHIEEAHLHEELGRAMSLATIEHAYLEDHNAEILEKTNTIRQKAKDLTNHTKHEVDKAQQVCVCFLQHVFST